MRLLPEDIGRYVPGYMEATWKASRLAPLDVLEQVFLNGD